MNPLRFGRHAAMLSLIVAVAPVLRAQAIPSAERVLNRMRVVNDQFLAAWPNPGADIVTDRARPSNLWTRATYMEGLLALHAIAPEQRYYDYAVRWGESHAWGLAYGSATDRNADDQACGQAYIELYAIDPRPERIRDITTAISGMVNSSKSDDWWWIDALHMAMPVFAKLGVLYQDPRYFSRMYDLYSNTRSVQGGSGLYNTTEHLWWRDADFDPPYKEPNGANCYWARGNGWVLAALVRVLDVLPETDPHRAEYIQTFQDMCVALAPLQRTDGFWNASLMDPANYGGRELSGTAFFVYGMAWGVRKGFLSRQDFMPVIARGWTALAESAVRPDGTLAYAQGSGKQPSDSQPVTYTSRPNFDDYGTGAFLLAGAEVYKLASSFYVDRISLKRTVLYNQIDTNTVVVPDGLSFRTDAEIGGTGLAAVNATLTLPDGSTTRTFVTDPATGSLLWTDAASSLSTLGTSTPNGTYLVAIAGRLIRSRALSGGADSASDSFPQTARATVDAGTWANGSLTINEAKALTITANGPVVDAARTSIARISIDGPRYHETRTSVIAPAARSAPLSLTLPPYALSAGNTYQVTLILESVDRQDVPAIPIGTSTVLFDTGLRKITTFDIAVTPATLSSERLVNVSGRGLVQSSSELIVGFCISAGDSKAVLIRGVGPTLSGMGVTHALTNPSLRLYNIPNTRGWSNDDWQGASRLYALTGDGTTVLDAAYGNAPTDAASAAQLSGAFALTARSRDAAIVAVLPAGNYTALVSGADGGSGEAVAEVFELAGDYSTAPRLTNLSVRGVVTPDTPLMASFIIRGGQRRVLIRAIGPGLIPYGVSSDSALANPRLSVFTLDGRLVGSNDDWDAGGSDTATQLAFRSRVGGFPLQAGGKDAELLIDLPEGLYSAHVTGATSGIALVEIYTEPPGS